jgi:hypothetical protein
MNNVTSPRCMLFISKAVLILAKERKALTIQPRKCRSDAIPSGQAPLMGPSPLRTVHASFPAHSSSTANASFRETRL